VAKDGRAADIPIAEIRRQGLIRHTHARARARKTHTRTRDAHLL
jgi:hypothetical protein